MRFMVMHKNDPHTEAGEKPPKELLDKMGAFIGEHAASGKFLDGAGLPGSSKRTRLVFRAGQCTKTHGPYRGEHELPASILLLKVRTRDEAIGWAERYGKILGDGELELGKVNEPWDIGLMPPPENPPLQMLLIDKADEASERAGARKSMVGSGDRSERIRTYNFPQGRVTDHRINLTLHKLDAILEGPGLAELVEALVSEDEAQRLAGLEEA